VLLQGDVTLAAGLNNWCDILHLQPATEKVPAEFLQVLSRCGSTQTHLPARVCSLFTWNCYSSRPCEAMGALYSSVSIIWIIASNYCYFWGQLNQWNSIKLPLESRMSPED